MQSFHITIHPRPAGANANETTIVDGIELTTLGVAPEDRNHPFNVSFEDAEGALAALPRMFVEPDGSFVWVSDELQAKTWQLDGVLYDQQGRLLYVELKGQCQEERLDTLLHAFGWPETPLMFQLIRHAVFLDDTAFRQFAFR